MRLHVLQVHADRHSQACWQRCPMMQCSTRQSRCSGHEHQLISGLRTAQGSCCGVAHTHRHTQTHTDTHTHTHTHTQTRTDKHARTHSKKRADTHTSTHQKPCN